MSYRYLLGDSGTETDRLKRQAKLWDPVSHALFDRLKVQPGMKVLEIGPGAGSLHRELRRRLGGPLDAVERSPVFAPRLPRGGRVWNCDLLDADLPPAHYDLIFCRWVFLFLPDPAAHLRQLVRALKPGGRLAIQDYHRETLGMIPPAEGWADFLAADLAFFASEGGDASIGGSLPDLFRASGLDVLEVMPTVKCGHPGSETWRWLSDYFLGALPRYARFRPFTPAKAARLRRHWLAAARDPAAVLIAPMVLDVVGTKPRSAKAR